MKSKLENEQNMPPSSGIDQLLFSANDFTKLNELQFNQEKVYNKLIILK